MADRASRDANFVPTLQAVSNIDGTSPVNLWADPISHSLINGGGIGLPSFDYVSMALSGGNTIETYTFKTGGSGGTTVATVTIVYTDSTRSVLSSVTKT